MSLVAFPSVAGDMLDPFWGLEALERITTALNLSHAEVVTHTSTTLSFRTTGPDPVETFIFRGSFDFSSLSALFGSTIRSVELQEGTQADPNGPLVLSWQFNATLNQALQSSDDSAFLNGPDKITGSAHADILEGFAGNDEIIGGAGSDVLLGDLGNDILRDGPVDSDELVGGLGNDTYYVTLAGDVLLESANQGVDTVISGVSLTLARNFENLTLQGSDPLHGTGNAFANVITGNGGDNVLDGGAGNDTLIGGAGNDAYFVDSALDKIVETLPGGTDTVHATASYVLPVNVEDLILDGSGDINATGNALVNHLTGNDGNNRLDGGLGADIMAGAAGNDTYVIDNVNDVVTELPGQGSDTIVIGRNVDLGSAFPEIENVTLSGAGAFNAIGDDNANTLIGNAAANHLTGAGGNDWLDGGLGNDTLDGGDGDDTYVVNSAADVIIDASGNDTVRASISFSLVLPAGLQMDNITLLGAAALNATGNASHNVLIGNAGANKLDGGGGADDMSGGAGSDTYFVDNVGDTVTESVAGAIGGIDLVLSSVSFSLTDNVENLTLQGSDPLHGTGNALANVITGNGGDNVLDGGAGNDTLIGGGGNDTYFVDSALDKVVETLPGGTDTVHATASYVLPVNVEDLILDDAGGDINATGNALVNHLTGNDGNNRLDGGAGADLMAGGAGNDTYVIDNVNDLVTELADQGNDTIVVNGAAFPNGIDLASFPNVENVTLLGTLGRTITGDERDNVLIGSAGSDIIHGGGGNDTLDGKGGAANQLFGGTGDDTYMISDLTHNVIVEQPGEGIDTVMSSVTFDLNYYQMFFDAQAPGHPGPAELENLTLLGTGSIDGTGNALDNHMIGNAGDNSLSGGAGNDILEGGAGDDLLVGGAGNDILDGGAGEDGLDGGTGDDRYIVDNPNDIVVELPGQGTDTVVSSISVNLSTDFLSVENVELTGSAALSATGNASDNHLTGNAGDNLLDGGTGNDVLEGGAGDDRFIFDPADTTSVAGGDGTDHLVFDAQGQTLDLNGLAGSVYSGIEAVDLTGTGNNQLSLTAQNVIDMSDTHQLRVDGNAGDQVSSNGQGWAQGPDETVGDLLYHTFTSGAATLHVDADVTLSLS